MDLLRAPVNASDHVNGLRTAPVVMVEYGDYECPYCVAAHEVVKELQSLLGSSMCFIFRNFPLTNEHPHAFDSAALAELAATEDKFWEVHDAIYERPNNLSFPLLESIAKSFSISSTSSSSLRHPTTASRTASLHFSRCSTISVSPVVSCPNRNSCTRSWFVG